MLRKRGSLPMRKMKTPPKTIKSKTTSAAKTPKDTARKVRRMKEVKKGSLILVRNESGKEVFRGHGRRRFTEDVKFDSTLHNERVFTQFKEEMSDARINLLRKEGRILREGSKRITAIDERNPKNRKRYLKKREAKE